MHLQKNSATLVYPAVYYIYPPCEHWCRTGFRHLIASTQGELLTTVTSDRIFRMTYSFSSPTQRLLSLCNLSRDVVSCFANAMARQLTQSTFSLLELLVLDYVKSASAGIKRLQKNPNKCNCTVICYKSPLAEQRRTFSLCDKTRNRNQAVLGCPFVQNV